MVNNVILVGRITGNPEIIEIEEGKKVSSVLLAVNRNFKNADGLYDTDFVRCILWNSIAENTIEYCRAGDVVGVKGRLQTQHYEDENGKTHYVTDVVAEAVRFLSSNKNRESTNENHDER
ncbi:MAG: single-stranded DNA-binding protein [Bacilli bacterium]|nr:single-stranded DNA-binding protein [Bacilli bacterium]